MNYWYRAYLDENCAGILHMVWAAALSLFYRRSKLVLLYQDLSLRDALGHLGADLGPGLHFVYIVNTEHTAFGFCNVLVSPCLVKVFILGLCRIWRGASVEYSARVAWLPLPRLPGVYMESTFPVNAVYLECVCDPNRW